MIAIVASLFAIAVAVIALMITDAVRHETPHGRSSVQAATPRERTSTTTSTSVALTEIPATPTTQGTDVSIEPLGTSEPPSIESEPLLIYDRAESGVFTIEADGSGRTLLFSAPESDVSDLEWSPDRRLVAGESIEGIFVSRPDGTDRWIIASGGQCPAWSPDGTRLAFACPNAYHQQICVIGVDGGDPVPVSEGKYGSIERSFGPSWSPDGNRLVYARSLTEYNPHIPSPPNTINDLVVVDVNTKTNTAIGGGSTVEPEWSPDGSAIAYGMGPEIWLVSADGTSNRQITSGVTIGPPRWSPDGSRLAFSGGGSIWLVTRGGGDLTTVPGLSNAVLLDW